MASILKGEESSWRQKSRDKWLEEGDCNTKYFYALATHRRCCNFIDEIWCEGKKFSGNKELREAARNYFSKLYDEEFSCWPKLDDLQFNRLLDASNQLLEVEFSVDEVADCLKSCNGNKSPGPDGFNMKFLQNFWYLIEDDVMGIFKELHTSGKFVRSLNSTFLVLVLGPKKKGSKKFKEFRPIRLVDCIYKLIAKILAMRLSRVLGEVIGECQYAFVEGRQIIDAAMAANKAVDDLMARSKDGLLCKLDMKKTYDHVSRNFVEDMLKRMCFGQKW